jgi:cytochrome b6-f complex iron-sulfur subunit
MSNYHVEPASEPQALSKEAIKSLRHEQVQGISRRTLIRTSLGAAIGLWILELGAGTIGFLWPSIASGSKSQVKIGTLAEIKAQNSSLPIDQGFPAYYQPAKSYVMLIDPSRQEFVPGSDPTGDGTALNVRALYQRCPHLGCKPNPCLKNFWIECPCHGSRYDRLGTKAKGTQFGPAPRGMDRFAIIVKDDQALYVDTLKITLGPLPVALGEPGLIPPKSPTGCI